MIHAEDIFPLLIQASPSFAPAWGELQNEWAEETSVPYYIALGDFARHMCALLAISDTATLEKIFQVLERLHLEGDDYVKEAATIGLLEDLQNANIHKQGTLPKQFETYLLPESARWWRKVEAFWAKGTIITDD